MWKPQPLLSGKIPGPVCMICWDLKKANPTLTLAEFIDLVRKSPIFCKKVKTARQVLLGQESLNCEFPGKVLVCGSAGTKLQVNYAVFTPKEFIMKYQVPHEDVGLQLTSIINEEKKPEKVKPYGGTRPDASHTQSNFGTGAWAR